MNVHFMRPEFITPKICIGDYDVTVVKLLGELVQNDLKWSSEQAKGCTCFIF